MRPPPFVHRSRRRAWRRVANRLTVLAIIAGLAAVGPFGPSARSAGTGDLAANRDKLGEIRKVLADVRADLDSVARAEKAAAAELAAAEAAARLAVTELANARAERAAAGPQAARLAAEFEQLQTLTGQRARALYISGGGGAMAAVVSTDDPAQLLDRAMRVEQQARSDDQLRADLAEARRIADDAQQRLEQAEARARAAAAAAAARADQLRQAQAVRAEAKRKLAERVAGYLKDYRQIEADSARVRRLLQGGAGAVADTGPPSAAGLRRPVSCPRTSGFGLRWGRMHEGVDFGCPTGTPVAAAAAGRVVSAGWSSGYGYLVLVDHGSIVTAYAHNSRLLVSAGQHVEAGQIISMSGSTGHSTGPHVHFEVRVNGVPRNPELYL